MRFCNNTPFPAPLGPNNTDLQGSLGACLYLLCLHSYSLTLIGLIFGASSIRGNYICIIYIEIIKCQFYIGFQ